MRQLSMKNRFGLFLLSGAVLIAVSFYVESFYPALFGALLLLEAIKLLVKLFNQSVRLEVSLTVNLNEHRWNELKEWLREHAYEHEIHQIKGARDKE
ncbi:hypothetical protein C8P63_104151 [Melghirimyces profundicolus]|uniref:Uncharacterized protein n=2 Tax=Melghirimyces profundicolus TaxID=1242148 RepID=A0A2T6C4R2_9BACL|nr:hypothetical protein C8P63_104151 [Melghirimyces profundicolus]